MRKLRGGLGVLAMWAALIVGMVLIAFKASGDNSPATAAVVPVRVFGSVGCAGTYVLWILMSDGTIVLRDESSGATIKQFAELLKGVPAQVRHFDDACALTT